jgi:excisionase family DNA binding protein
MPSNPGSQDLTCKPTRKVPGIADEAGLLMIDQAAAYLNVTEDQVAGFVQDGELSYINMGRGKKRARYRFTKSDLDAFIEQRRRREVFCQSTNPKSRRSTTTPSRSVVVGFTARRNARLAGKQKPSRP